MTPELQIKIYDLVKSGRSYNSVAKELGIGKTTVSTNYLKIRNDKEDCSERSEIMNKKPILTNLTPALASDTTAFEYKVPDIPQINVPAKNVPPTHILSGPLVELMESLPPNFKGTIESHSAENASKFAWRFACFLSQHHAPVEIITTDIARLKRLSESDPGHDKIIIRKCETTSQIKNEIGRTNAPIIILDSIESLKIPILDWVGIIDSNPDKAIISLRKQGFTPSYINFVAKVDTNFSKSVRIKTLYGIIEFDIGFSLSNLYTSKNT